MIKSKVVEAERKYIINYTIVGDFAEDKPGEHTFAAGPGLSTNLIRREVSDATNTAYRRVRLDDVRILPVEVIQ